MGAASGAIQLGGGLYNIIEGGKRARAAAGALGAYDRQDLTQNAYEGLTPSLLGARMQQEEQARLAASQTEALQGGGVRALVGGLGRVEAGNQMVNQRIGADIDQQMKERDRLMADDRVRTRAMQEARENADIAALSSQYDAAQNQKAQGIGNVIQAGSSIASAFGGGGASDMASAARMGGFSTSGGESAIGGNNAAYMSPASARFDQSYGSGYATPPVLTNPSYNPANFGPQNYQYPNVNFPVTNYGPY